MSDAKTEHQARAIAAKAGAVALLRELFRLKGAAEPAASATMLEMLSDGTYRQKVVDYLAEHADLAVIHKIRNLEPVDADDLRELERILWHELSTKSDYLNTTDIRNLAAFVRSIVGLEQTAVNEKFGKYLNDSTLTLDQQEFLKTIIDYVRENGDITKDDLLSVSPFDAYDIVDLFGNSIEPVNEVVFTLGTVIAEPVGFFDYSFSPTRHPVH